MSWNGFASAKFVQLFDPALACKGGGVLNKRDSEEDNSTLFGSTARKLFPPVYACPSATLVKAGLQKVD